MRHISTKQKASPSDPLGGLGEATGGLLLATGEHGSLGELPLGDHGHPLGLRCNKRCNIAKAKVDLQSITDKSLLLKLAKGVEAFMALFMVFTTCQGVPRCQAKYSGKG